MNFRPDICLHVPVLGYSHGQRGRKVQRLWSLPVGKNSRPVKTSLGCAEEAEGGGSTGGERNV